VASTGHNLREEALRASEIELVGRLPWSSNLSFVVRLLGKGGGQLAVYKPGRGERPLFDFPPDLYRREIAAYELCSGIGLDLVPETVLRLEAPFGPGSLQQLIDADFSAHYFSLYEEHRYDRALRLLAGFDLLANNADRKAGHVLIDADGHIFGIDHGLSFHEEPKLRTVIWEFADEELPEEILRGCERVIAAVREWPLGADEPEVAGPRPARCAGSAAPPDLERLARVRLNLSGREWRALGARAEALLAASRFPSPDPRRHCYPWPLV
jgi:uncharacterized repeat protein (TIGR03843 family)